MKAEAKGIIKVEKNVVFGPGVVPNLVGQIGTWKIVGAQKLSSNEIEISLIGIFNEESKNILKSKESI